MYPFLKEWMESKKNVNMSHALDGSTSETASPAHDLRGHNHDSSRRSDPGPSLPAGLSPASGRISPGSNRNMKDFGTQISDLKKENFSLKLRIFYMEERMLERFSGDQEQLWRSNIELKVECESLRKDLAEKHDLLVKASNAVACMEQGDPEEIQKAKIEAMQEVAQLREVMNAKVEAVEKELHAAHQDSELALQRTLAIKKENEDLKSENKDLNEALAEAKDTLENVKTHPEQYLDESYLKPSADQEDKVAQLQNQIDDLCAELDEKQRTITQLQGSLATKQTFIELLSDEKQSVMKEQVQPLMKKVEELEQKLKESEFTSNDQQQFEEAHQRYQDLLLLQEDYQELITEQQQRLDEFELATKQMSGELEKREDELQTLKTSMKEQEKAAEELKAQLDKQTAETNEANNRTLKDMNKRDRAIAGLSQVAHKKDEEISSLRQEIDSLEKEVQELKDNIIEKDSKTDQLLADIRKHEVPKSSPSKDGLLHQLREQLKESDAALQDALDEKERIDNEHEKSSREQTIQIREKNRQIDRLKAQNTDYEETVSSLDANIREKDRELQEVATKHKNVLRDLQQKENERLRAVRERDELVKQCEEEKMRFSELASKMRRRSSTDFSSNSSLVDVDSMKRIRDLEDELRKKNEALREANIAKEQAQADLDITRSELEKVLYDRDEEFNKSNRAIAMRDVEIRQLKDLLRNKEEALHDSESQQRFEVEKLTRQTSALRGRLRSTEEEFDKYKAKTDSNKRSSQESDGESIRRNDNSLQEQIEYLKKQLDIKEKEIKNLQRASSSFNINVHDSVDSASDSEPSDPPNVTYNYNTTYQRRPKSKRKNKDRHTVVHNHNVSYVDGAKSTPYDSAKEPGRLAGLDRLRQVHAENRVGNMTLDTTFGVPLDQTSYMSMPDGYHSDNDVQNDDVRSLTLSKLRQLLQDTRSQLSGAIREVAELKRTCSENGFTIEQLESLLNEKSAENTELMKRFEEINREKMAKDSEVLGLLARLQERGKSVGTTKKSKVVTTGFMEDSASDHDSAVSSCRSRRLSGDESDGMSSLSRKELRGIINNLRKKLANAEKVNELMKRQLHDKTDHDSLNTSNVDPQLITQLTAEVERLKEKLKIQQEKHAMREHESQTFPNKLSGNNALPSKLPVPKNYKGGHHATENPLRPELDRARMLNRKLNDRLAATEQTVRQQADKLNKCRAALKAAGIASPPTSPMRGARSVPNLFTAGGILEPEKVTTIERISSTSVDTNEAYTQTERSSDSGISSVSPRSEQRFNSLIQSQAKELSLLREQLKKSRDACRQLQTEMDIMARYMTTLLATGGDDLDASLVSGVNEELERSRKLVAKLRKSLSDNIDEATHSGSDSDGSSLASPIPLLPERKQLESLKNEINEKNSLLNELRDKVRQLETSASPHNRHSLLSDAAVTCNTEKWLSTPNLHPASTNTPLKSRMSTDAYNKRPSSSGSPFRSRDYGVLTPASSHQSLHSATEEEIKRTQNDSSRLPTRLGEEENGYPRLSDVRNGPHSQNRASRPADYGQPSPNSSFRRSMPLYQRTIAVTEYLPPNVLPGEGAGETREDHRQRHLPTTSDASLCTASYSGQWASEVVDPRNTEEKHRSSIRSSQSPVVGSNPVDYDESSCDDASSQRNHKLSREVDRLRRRLADSKRINKSLKEELELANKSVLKMKEIMLPGYHRSAHQNAGVLAEHLSEIRGLRQRLEQSFATNDKLSEQLEARLRDADSANRERLSANIFVEAENGHFSHSKEVQGLQQKLGQLEVENDNLRKRLKAEEKAHTTYEDAIQEMKAMQQNLSEKSSKIDHLAQHIKHVQYELEQQSSLSNKLGAELSDKDREIAHFKIKLERSENENKKIRMAEEKAAESASRAYSDLETAKSHSNECAQLIESLKSELSLYEKLHASKQLASLSPTPQFDLGELLQEIRSLRIQLERSIDANAALRKQLEEQLKNPRNRDESSLTTINIHHMTRRGSSKKDKAPIRTSPHSVRRKLKLEPYSVNDSVLMTPPASASSCGEEQGFYFDPDLTNRSSKSPFKARDILVASSPLKGSDVLNGAEDPLSRPFYTVGGPYTLCKTDDFIKLQQSVAKSGLIVRSTDSKLAEKMKLSHRPASPEKKILREIWRSISSLCQHVDDSEQLLRLFWPAVIPYPSHNFPVGDGRARTYSSSGVATGGQCSSNESPNSARRQESDSAGDYSVNSETDGLRREVGKLRRRLSTQDRLLQTTVERLHNTNRLKEGIEDAIVKQLSRTHDVLRKARGNLEAKVQSPR